ncbi:hypothetical protein ARMGADRAFT_1093191 [Armillaria gallica]|uniref:Uncharacterized protein n=1 Tax=Armillaria gallica TaxID=47427 RepID=A0A2H3CBX7_ARMGA|nr:hypothetical protein ARMGADRAFT_1093191 [Armillaria gallica]
MNPLHATLLRSRWPSFYFIPPTSLPAVVTVTMRSLSPGYACQLSLDWSWHKSARASQYHLNLLSRIDARGRLEMRRY